MANPVITDHGRGVYRADPAGMAGSKASVVNFAGAALSLALVVGTGIWGYQLVMRDVSGVPVVRALEGPMRVAPDRPGGTIASHQGLAVNAVQAEGVAEAPADRLVLAPEGALLQAEDQPQPDLSHKPRSRVVVAETLQPGEDLATPASLTEEIEAPTDPVSEAMALAEKIAADAEPFDEDAIEPLEESEEPETLTEEVADSVKSGVARSPLPAPRPAFQRSSPATDANVVLATAQVSDTTRATLAALSGLTDDETPAQDVAVGTRLVQLGAYDTENDARGIWEKLRNTESFAPLMEDKSIVIQEAQKGGRTFFRLRALGFADLSDARRFCAALLAEKADCIPVVAR